LPTANYFYFVGGDFIGDQPARFDKSRLQAPPTTVCSCHCILLDKCPIALRYIGPTDCQLVSNNVLIQKVLKALPRRLEGRKKIIYIL
ncbi:MAG: hypothetical protein RI563_10445, partial [Thiohalophilus sp.]|uniref:hypothetical protein n=1 Tax=Thiohalophilus sp. TaxID=3028392 RepID=UPI00286FF084